METILVRTSSSVGESNLHLQITPAYRQDVFENRKLWELIVFYIEEKLKKMNIILLVTDGGPDHAHLFLANWKKYAIEKIVQGIKGFSSYMIRKFHKELIKDKLWGKKFWSEGYFYRTVGQVTKEACTFYIEHSQSKHWTALDYAYYKDNKQINLTNYM